jgi:DNA mismatch repair protein MutH
VLSAHEPRSEAELLDRARALAGRTVAELADACGRALPADPRRAKGFVGGLVEQALAVAPTPGAAGPDLPALGIEVKTIPLDVSGRPRESTFVCTLPLGRLERERWETSAVRTKLARVLWVPIETRAEVAWTARRVGAAWLWSPDGRDEATLRTDWEGAQALVARGGVDALDARRGVALQVRPKARDGRARVRAPGEDEAPTATMPRGFYLRASFTAAIVRACYPGLR